VSLTGYAGLRGAGAQTLAGLAYLSVSRLRRYGQSMTETWPRGWLPCRGGKDPAAVVVPSGGGLMPWSPGGPAQYEGEAGAGDEPGGVAARAASKPSSARKKPSRATPASLLPGSYCGGSFGGTHQARSRRTLSHGWPACQLIFSARRLPPQQRPPAGSSTAVPLRPGADHNPSTRSTNWKPWIIRSSCARSLSPIYLSCTS
jgi:hypothetical protein